MYFPINSLDLFCCLRVQTTSQLMMREKEALH